MTVDSKETIALIRGLHRQRRFAMKVQQKLDRSLESFLRINATNWNPNADEAEREKANREVKELIKRIRAGEPHELAVVVHTTDRAREPADEMRAAAEKAMEKAAKDLPVFAWIESIRGAGALGLATIVAEAGDLADYAGPAKLWKRLGFAPYDGCAGSTWKRETWRPRALTADEWIANPFSGERYALMHQVATWLVNTQVESAEKSETEFGRPTGPFGELYVRRREHMKEYHPDWTDGHCRKDALRIAMKAFLRDLWCEWNPERIVIRTRKVKVTMKRGARHAPRVEAT
jgi:hypothetical protein